MFVSRVVWVGLSLLLVAGVADYVGAQCVESCQPFPRTLRGVVVGFEQPTPACETVGSFEPAGSPSFSLKESGRDAATFGMDAAAAGSPSVLVLNRRSSRIVRRRLFFQRLRNRRMPVALTLCN